MIFFYSNKTTLAFAATAALTIARFDGRSCFADAANLRRRDLQNVDSSSEGETTGGGVQGQGIATNITLPERCFFGNGASVTEQCKDSGAGCCVGPSACTMKESEEVTICEGSCVGNNACMWLSQGSYIGSNSCVGEYSCAHSEIVVGENSCQTGTEEGNSHVCQGAEGTIGSNSCIDGSENCKYITGTIGDDSCNNGDKICRSNHGIIGNRSCNNGNSACFYNRATSTIGDDSCNNGNDICNTNVGKIGNGSCNVGDDVCKINAGEIGDNSCNYVPGSECAENGGVIGEGNSNYRPPQ